ncbi:DMT family transporter [Maridesulfovibrio sp.]|uniref:DMT family transporter n=1 Tax=Maridesulfovibrio sp. TaxID=2795000 RepID=UPI003BABAB3F
MNTGKKTGIKPIQQVLTGAFVISFSAVWVGVADVPATTSAFYRVFFGAVFLFIAAAFSGELKQIRPKQVLPYSLCGFLFALDLFFWHESILLVGPGLATILGNCQVFIMALCGALFLNEKLTPRFIFSLPIAIFGLLLLIGFNWAELSQSSIKGIIYGLLTALSYALFMLMLRRIQAHKEADLVYSPLLFVSAFCAMFLAVPLFLTDASFAIPTLESFGSLLALGLFSQAVGWIMIATAMPKIPASITGLVLLLQPFLSFLWDVLIFSRLTTLTHWLGVIVTLTAIYLGVSGKQR